MLTREKVEEYTERSALIADDYKTRWNDCRLDADVVQRRKSTICKTCWYILRPRSSAHLRTYGACKHCSAKITSETTYVNMLCDKCSEHHQLCKECGARA